MADLFRGAVDGAHGDDHAEHGGEHVDEHAVANCRERTRLVAIVRWLLLLVLALYGALAGSTYLFSRYGFFITKEQTLLLALTLLSVLIYNLTFHFYRGEGACSNFARLQIILDLTAVTVLIHCSGGATSWFWPVYMIVTLEAAYLMENQRDVWQIGAAGGLLYCTLLFLESDQQLVGILAASDTLRPEVPAALAEARSQGFEQLFHGLGGV